MEKFAERQEEIKNLIIAANVADESGLHEEANRLTALAHERYAAMEDDADAEDAGSPVDSEDPFAKGFGKSVKTLCKKLDTMCGTNNLKKKLKELCEAAGCEANVAREAERALEDACDALSKLCH